MITDIDTTALEPAQVGDVVRLAAGSGEWRVTSVNEDGTVEVTYRGHGADQGQPMTFRPAVWWKTVGRAVQGGHHFEATDPKRSL